MVCNGDMLIFGVEMTYTDMIDLVKSYVEIRCDSRHAEELENLNSYANYEVTDILNNILRELKFKIQIIHTPCCLFGSKNFQMVYLGVKLSNSAFLIKQNPVNFVSFEAYEKYFTENLNNAKRELEKNKDIYIEEMSKITQKNPIFVSLPNDCFSCT